MPSKYPAYLDTVQHKGRIPTLPLYIFGVLAYALVFYFLQREPVPLNVHAVACLVAATCFAPLARWYACGCQGIPVFEMICLSYVLNYCIPIYIAPRELDTILWDMFFTWNEIYEALWLVELGVISLIVGYYATLNFAPLRRLPKADLSLSAEQVSRYVILAIAIRGLIIILRSLGLLRFGAIGAFVILFENQLTIAMILLTYQVYDPKKSNGKGKLALVAIVILVALLGMRGGMLGSAFSHIFLLAIALWHIRRSPPWRLLILLLIAITILNPIKGEYRSEVWYGSEVRGFGHQLALWQALAEERIASLLSPGEPVNVFELANAGLQRFSIIYKFAHVRRITPAIVPFYKGATYAYFLYAPIPRFVWPNKPAATIYTHMLDVDYGLVPRGSSTGVGVGQLAEAYANFDVPGIALVLGMQGIILAIFASILNSPTSQGGRAVYLSIMQWFLIDGINTATVMLMGAMPQHAIANVAILYVFKKLYEKDEKSKGRYSIKRTYSL